jgi:hypothetical protein
LADLGYVKTLIRGIPDEKTRSILDQVMTHVLGNLRHGVPEHQVRSENGQQYWQQSTSASDTSEFSILHGLPAAPHYGIPVLEFDRVGSKAGFLTVSRVADGKRIYLKADAGSTGAQLTWLVE